MFDENIANIMIALMVLVLAYILWLGSTARTPEGRENYYYGLLIGVGFSFIAWLTGKANSETERADKIKYKYGVVKRFVDGLKNLFIRK
jgi:bacteriorhodopsin